MQFSEIPSNNLVPMFFTEFDNSNAVKGGAMPWKNLIIGQPLSTKSTYVGHLVKVESDEQVDSYFGEGSQLALMCRAFRKNSKTSELWALPVADVTADSNAAASATVTCTVASSGIPYAGVVHMMIGGQVVEFGVAANDDATTVATKMKNAINAKANLPVTATSSTGTVTITAKNLGVSGEGIDIRFNHYQGEEIPEGLSFSDPKMDGGGVDPTYSASNVGNIIEGTWFNTITIGSDTTANIGYIKDLLDERWTATVQQTGVLFVSLNKTGSDAEKSDYTTAGESLNSQVVVLPALPKCPTPGFEIAAAVVGCIAPKSLNDPAAPLSNYEVKGIISPRAEDRLGLSGNNDLLIAGCALLVAGASGEVLLKRVVTTYKRTPNGASDTSYQQLERIFTLSYLRWDWNNYMAGRYPHAKLADDGNDFGPGQTVMTPNLGKGELLGRYEYWMGKGLVQNYDEFKANLVVIRDPDDNTALQFLIPADLVSQFFIGKSKIQFK